jgi:hypothetical protein
MISRSARVVAKCGAGEQIWHQDQKADPEQCPRPWQRAAVCYLPFRADQKSAIGLAVETFGVVRHAGRKYDAKGAFDRCRGL